MANVVDRAKSWAKKKVEGELKSHAVKAVNKAGAKWGLSFSADLSSVAVDIKAANRELARKRVPARVVAASVTGVTSEFGTNMSIELVDVDVTLQLRIGEASRGGEESLSEGASEEEHEVGPDGKKKKKLSALKKKLQDMILNRARLSVRNLSISFVNHPSDPPAFLCRVGVPRLDLRAEYDGGILRSAFAELAQLSVSWDPAGSRFPPFLHPVTASVTFTRKPGERGSTEKGPWEAEVQLSEGRVSLSKLQLTTFTAVRKQLMVAYKDRKAHLDGPAVPSALRSRLAGKVADRTSVADDGRVDHLACEQRIADLEERLAAGGNGRASLSGAPVASTSRAAASAASSALASDASAAALRADLAVVLGPQAPVQWRDQARHLSARFAALEPLMSGPLALRPTTVAMLHHCCKDASRLLNAARSAAPARGIEPSQFSLVEHALDAATAMVVSDLVAATAGASSAPATTIAPAATPPAGSIAARAASLKPQARITSVAADTTRRRSTVLTDAKPPARAPTTSTSARRSGAQATPVVVRIDATSDDERDPDDEEALPSETSRRSSRATTPTPDARAQEEPPPARATDGAYKPGWGTIRKGLSTAHTFRKISHAPGELASAAKATALDSNGNGRAKLHGSQDASSNSSSASDSSDESSAPAPATAPSRRSSNMDARDGKGTRDVERMRASATPIGGRVRTPPSAGTASLPAHPARKASRQATAQPLSRQGSSAVIDTGARQYRRRRAADDDDG